MDRKSEKCLQEIVFSEHKITWKYLDIRGQVFSSFLYTHTQVIVRTKETLNVVFSAKLD